MKTPLLIVSLIASVTTALAVDPPPGGGYSGENTALGDDALFSLTTGTNNSANGYDALYNTTTGIRNTANGHNALFSNTTGSSSTATGDSALYGNTTGGANTADGFNALYSNTSGEFNVAVGHFALYLNTTASSNTAVGVSALQTNTEGAANVAMGSGAVLGNTIGSFNTGIGGASLSQNSSGSNNVALGYAALAKMRDGSNNIAVGLDAGGELKFGDWNIYLGSTAVKQESGTIRIGDHKRTNAYIAGISGVTVASGVGVVVDSSGHLGTMTSSARFKDKIQPMSKASEAILSLQPVTFCYKKELDPEAIPQFGLVAEDVAKVDPDLVARDEEGKPYTVRYEAVNAMLLNEFLKAHKTIEQQTNKIQQLESSLKELTARLDVKGL